MSDEKLDEVRNRHAEAIERFGSYYFANAPFGKPQLRIGVQSFSFDYAPEDEDPRHDAAHREWFGIMIAAALKNLVDGETAALEAKLAEAKEALVDIISVGGCYGGAAHMQKVDEIARTALAKMEKEND